MPRSRHDHRVAPTYYFVVSVLPCHARAVENRQSGLCTSPRTLHELSKLHADRPGQVQTLLASGAEITRTAVSAIRAAPEEAAPTEPAASPPDKLITHANAACDRLEWTLGRIKPTGPNTVALPELAALRVRVEDITMRSGCEGV